MTSYYTGKKCYDGSILRMHCLSYLPFKCQNLCVIAEVLSCYDKVGNLYSRHNLTYIKYIRDRFRPTLDSSGVLRM